MRDIIPYENKYPLDKRSDDEILEQRRGSFIDFISLDRILNHMTQEQKGDFLDSVWRYFKSDVQPDESLVGERVCSAFDIFQPLEVSNRAKYVQKCRRQRHNALKKNKKNKDDEQDEEDSHGYPGQAMADDKDIETESDVKIKKEIIEEAGLGVAIATLIDKPSSSFTAMSTEDIQPLQMVDNLPDYVFEDADISKDIVTDIVSHFCTAYKEKMHKPCPHISEEFAETIPESIAVLIDRSSGEYLIDQTNWNTSAEFYTKCYQDIIDKYFSTDFSEECNYSLQHFFSGKIRVLKYYEVGRQPYEYE